MKLFRARLAGALLIICGASKEAIAQTESPLMPIDYKRTVEWRMLDKAVFDSVVVDDMSDPSTWVFQGTGKISFGPATGGERFKVLKVDMDMFTDKPAPTKTGLSSVNLRRKLPGVVWTKYNRISMWIKPSVVGFPMLPLQIVLHNDGAVKVPDIYNREGTHYVTLLNDAWQHVVWEITPLARDKVTSLEIGYWVNKMLAQPGDRVSFEIGNVQIERVNPDNFEGWDVRKGQMSVNMSGYSADSPKKLIASGVNANRFSVYRQSDRKWILESVPVTQITNRLGKFQQFDVSSIREPGRYLVASRGSGVGSFEVKSDPWASSIWKTLNFFYGERCGYDIPGVHDVDHQDWFATLGGEKIVMNGGWHDAGDLSQGVINTGEATYAMFSLAESLKTRGGDPKLVARLIDEANWGLDWVMKVRFPGGYRISFASHNLWSNNIVGDADDRLREAKNNPNANYIAASAEAIAYRVLKDIDTAKASRALALAEEDWGFAIAGKEGAETWHTPAFAATPIEIAGIGILASLELYSATSRKLYADKAVELAKIILASQQRSYVGSTFPLAGFFYTGPDRDTLFHQFHRGNDQAPIVALAKLADAFPDHPDWIKWYAAVAMYSEYQEKSAQTTEPYRVLPSYVYTDKEYLQRPEKGALHLETREAFREQVLSGMPMGDGYFLKVFPVWFARKGNFGILLSQAKALSTAARLRRSKSGKELAQLQAEWIVGRNPFVQSMMYGEGYNYAQQYSVSSGDFVGSLPVGMQSRGNTDLPYWPQQNTYVYKEVWVHPSARWLWLMEELTDEHMTDAKPTRRLDYSVTSVANSDSSVTIAVDAKGMGSHTFAVRFDNLVVNSPTKKLALSNIRQGKVIWTANVVDSRVPWVAVIIPNGDVAARREVVGYRGLIRKSEQAADPSGRL